jgi:hypothetical protein
LNKWESGVCIEAPFAVKKYEGMFMAHLKSLERQRDDDSSAMELYCKCLVELAQK